MEDWEEKALHEATLEMIREHPLARWHPQYFVLWNKRSMKQHEPLKIIKLGKTRMVAWDGKSPVPGGTTQTIYFPSSKRYVCIQGTRHTYFIERGELLLPHRPLPGQLEPDVLAEVVLTWIPENERTPYLLIEEVIRYSFSFGLIKER